MKNIQFFSEETNKFYKLLPTDDWPTLEISGIRMHRTKDTTPKRDAENKIKVIGRLYGHILDVCTGLGYTAILAARFWDVEEVVTIEKDKNIILIARNNPFSAELFFNEKIKLILGDASKVVEGFPENYFNFIFHDPPRISFAPELYTEDFYRELFRVLKRRGKLLHYVPSQTTKRTRKGTMERLRRVGFKVKKIDKLGCVLCFKF